MAKLAEFLKQEGVYHLFVNCAVNEMYEVHKENRSSQDFLAEVKRVVTHIDDAEAGVGAYFSWSLSHKLLGIDRWNHMKASEFWSSIQNRFKDKIRLTRSRYVTNI
jgi:hypothetical protein